MRTALARKASFGADKRYPKLQTIQDLFKAFGFNSSTIITCKHWYLTGTFQLETRRRLASNLGIVDSGNHLIEGQSVQSNGTGDKLRLSHVLTWTVET